jgi:hypothetical protein
MNSQLVRNVLSLTILGLVLAMGFSVSSAWAFGPCSECEFELVMCENGAETAYDFCVDECEGDPGCEADCDARYEEELWMCEMEYDFCTWNCEV